MSVLYAATDGIGCVQPLRCRFPDLTMANDYAAALTDGTILETDMAVAKHPELALCASTDVEHAVSGAHWPVRIFEVFGEPVDLLARGRYFLTRTVHQELEIEKLFGPGGTPVAALLDMVMALKADTSLLAATVEALRVQSRQLNPQVDPRHEPAALQMESAPAQAQWAPSSPG